MDVKPSPSLLKRYILNTSFHGFRYIAEPNRHWTERVFWFLCCCISWWISGVVIRSTWDSYKINAISFVVDTSYRDWDTEFPTIFVCEMDNEEKIAMASDRLYGDPHDYNLDEIARELAFYNEHYFFTLEMCGPNNMDYKDVCSKGNNFSKISFEVRSICPELFRHCKWNSEEFDCCKFFTAIDTDIGMCYAVNSLQIRKKDILKYPMISNRELGTGSLRLELNGKTNVYILGSLEVPSVITSGKDFIQLMPHVYVKRSFSIKDIENQHEVRYLAIQQRKCRYADENYLDVFPYYSYSACLMQCRKDAQLQKCGCTHHHMPNTSFDKQCSYAGLACIQNNFQELMVQKPPGSEKIGLECDCLPSCSEKQLDVVTDNKIGFSEGYSILELSLKTLPTERYKRNVVKGLLDVTVSIGSATALFMGASFLSFIEILYYFLVRPLNDYIRA